VWANAPGARIIDDHWVHQDLDLASAVADSPSLQLKWRLTADQDGVEFGGWNIDNVALVRIDADPVPRFTTYGAGCPGSTGLVPQLRSSSNSVVGGDDLQIEITKGLPNGLGFLLASSTPDHIPLSGGCFLLVSLPYSSATLKLNGQGGATLNGSASMLPSGAHLDFQFFGLDVAAPNGEFSSSNGLDLQMP